ncbi:carbohydrate ABC transporter permease [Levilinea saccharolytica]|uniref:carbohydrate ABC transporter permease n=1 Tax=Levilinea saccharolytica TaxID=229921 RepID=UPI0007822D7B|nr:carbohydrate ABC transporter permease [Levilinea saccharolytica]
MGSYAILILLAVLYVGPLFMLVNTSLKTMPSFMKDATSLTTSLNFENFSEAWTKANFPKYLLNSVLYTVAATTIYIITAVFVAFPIARKYIKFSGAVLTLFVIALFLPPALIPQFQLILNLGLYNNPIGYIMLFIVNPIGIVILVNYIKTVPKELDEAAALDGCGYFRFVWSIVLPLIRPAIATVVVMHSIGIWNEIIAPTIYLTNKDYYPITRGLIVFQGVYGSNWPTLAAAVLLLTLPMLVLFLVLQRYIVSGLTAGAVKG